MFLFSVSVAAQDFLEIFRLVLLILMVVGSIFMIAVVLFQPGNSEGMGSLGGGQSDTYFDKNKSHNLEGLLKRITVITAIVLMVICVLFFITVAIYEGGAA